MDPRSTNNPRSYYNVIAPSSLRADANGAPLNRQVPKTFTQTTTAVLALTGADVPDTDQWDLQNNPAGAQVYTISAQQFYNFVNREISLMKRTVPAAGGSTAIRLPANYFYSATGVATGVNGLVTIPNAILSDIILKFCLDPVTGRGFVGISGTTTGLVFAA